ncbi:MAG: hypothetical protein F6K30_08950 [Cyanothece sp. SIO2G6]|nr:hypothetical protein [Cyanothece sp. SIO2G6]
MDTTVADYQNSETFAGFATVTIPTVEAFLTRFQEIDSAAPPEDDEIGTGRAPVPPLLYRGHHGGMAPTRITPFISDRLPTITRCIRQRRQGLTQLDTEATGQLQHIWYSR